MRLAAHACPTTTVCTPASLKWAGVTQGLGKCHPPSQFSPPVRLTPYGRGEEQEATWQ